MTLHSPRIEQDLEDLEYYIVGGAVRDYLMDNEPKDLDYVVTGETEDSMLERNFNSIMAEFPIFMDSKGDEWALARTEEKSGKGYKGFQVYSNPNVSLEEDLERRDFTINAMAYNPCTDEFIDPYNGRKDIDRGMIHHVSDAFSDDPLRVLRACRFASRFDFDIDLETLQLCQKVSPELTEIPSERVGDEIIKAMEQAIIPSKFWSFVELTGASDYIFPELNELLNIPAGPEEYHQEPTTYHHVLMVVDEMYEEEGNNPIALLSALLHDVGKIETDGEVHPHHYGHASESPEYIDRICDRWKLPNLYRDAIRVSAREHNRFRHISDIRRMGKIIDLTDRLTGRKYDDMVELMLSLTRADQRGRRPPNYVDTSRHREIMEKSIAVMEDISGEDILREHDIEPGEKVGVILHQKRAEELRSRLNEEC